VTVFQSKLVSIQQLFCSFQIAKYCCQLPSIPSQFVRVEPIDFPFWACISPSPCWCLHSKWNFHLNLLRWSFH